MLRLDKARSADAFRRREPAPHVQTVNKARHYAHSIVGVGTTHIFPDKQAPHTSVRMLAAQVLLALPGGPWWTIQDCLDKHLQAAMTSERIGKAHLCVPALQQVLAKLGIDVTCDDLINIAVDLQAWHRDKGIYVSTFVRGIIDSCKAFDSDVGDVDPLASTDMSTAHSKREEVAKMDEADDSGTKIHFPYYNVDGMPIEGKVQEVMKINSPLHTMSSKDLLKMKSLTSSTTKWEDVEQPAHAKDWRMLPGVSIREAELRNNPAVTKRWQTVQMPTGAWLHTEQLGHYDPLPPSRLPTPRLDLDATGHLTTSELLVFRSLKKSMATDQPFSKMNSFSRLAAPMPRHKPLASALSTRSMPRHAHLVQELALPNMDTGHRPHPSGSQTERAMRATKPNFIATVPTLSGGTFRSHPSWAPTVENRWPEPLRSRAEFDLTGLCYSRPSTRDFNDSQYPSGGKMDGKKTSSTLSFATTTLDILADMNR